MVGMSAQDHLRIARRLHFQGNIEEAIKEYELVLELDPDNNDALSGLRALDIEPSVGIFQNPGAVKHAGGLKTNFLVNQARASEEPGIKSTILKVLISILGIGTIYSIYTLGTLILNHDNIIARDNVLVTFEKPSQKNGQASVNVVIVNLNPQSVKNMLVSYKITDLNSKTLKEGTLKLPSSVPAGDRRTFASTSLGNINGTAAKLSPQLTSLQTDKKPKLTEKLIEEFRKTAEMKDKDALYAYEALVQEADNFAPAYIGLGRAYVANSKLDKALQQYKRALEIDPDNANGHYCLGVALFYMKKYDSAQKELDIAAELAPDDPEISWNQKYLCTLREISKPATNTRPHHKRTAP